MKRMERYLERKIFYKERHIEILRGELQDLKRELKKLRMNRSHAQGGR